MARATIGLAGLVPVLEHDGVMHSTPPLKLALSKTHAAALKAAAANAFPAECCGLLVGHGDGVLTVTRVVAAANVAENPERHFLIDPQVQFDVLRGLRGSSERVIGHYHSHPNGSATLSAHDVAMADDPAAIWVLVPAGNGKPGALQAFQCQGFENQAGEGQDGRHAVPLVLEIV